MSPEEISKFLAMAAEVEDAAWEVLSEYCEIVGQDRKYLIDLSFDFDGVLLFTGTKGWGYGGGEDEYYVDMPVEFALNSESRERIKQEKLEQRREQEESRLELERRRELIAKEHRRKEYAKLREEFEKAD